jgi:general secretion pathway protein D
VLAVLAALVLGGCASSALRAGRAASDAGDHDTAVAAYTQVLREDPDNREARQALEVARLRASQDHFTRGRRHEAAGRLDEALVALQLAQDLNPGSGEIDDLLRRVRTQLRDRVAVTREGQTALEELVERSRDFQPDGFELPADIQMPANLAFDGSSRDVLIALGMIGNVSVVFDPQFVAQPVSLNVTGASFTDALRAVTSAARAFFQVTGERTITVAPDTPEMRAEYEQEITRVFYLSNADVDETIDTLRIVVDARRVAPAAGINAIVMKDVPERVEAASRIIARTDKARPEVVIDVELLEVDRTRLLEYGLQLASPSDSTPATGINGIVGLEREMTLNDFRNLTQSDIFLTNLPSLYYRALKNDTGTRTLAKPQLRTSEGLAAQANFGERVPIPVTVFSPIAAGGVNQQPITSFNYENIGVNIDITPRTHHDDEVSLAVSVEVSSISGTGFGGLPTFGNREINTVIRLRDGETNLLAGLIRDDERRLTAGIPGLSDIPVLGQIFSQTRRQTQETDIVLVLTPHIVRGIDIQEGDLRPFRVGRNLTTPAATVPLPVPLPGAQPPAPVAAPPGGLVLPIAPPTADPGPGPDDEN